jgi:hypothetical protein
MSEVTETEGARAHLPSKIGLLVRLAIAAACLAAVLGILLVVFSFTSLFFLTPLAAMLATLLAAAALTDTVLRHNRRGVAWSAVSLAVSGMVLLPSILWFWRDMREYYRAAREYWTTAQVRYAVVEYYDLYKHAPKTLDDLLGAGLLKGGVEFLHTYFLAPLDDQLLQSDLWQVPQNESLYDILVAYRPAGEEGVPGAWLYVDGQGHVGTLPPLEVVEWLKDQREAMTWLDESFPLADLERIAQTDSGRRGRMGSAILGYRQLQREKKPAEIQKQGP